MPRYNPQSIEPKWQAYWEANETFRTSVEPRVEGPGKSYILDMFPYPSGDGLHVGHPEGYTATDILARRDRMLGKHVLHPMGWDAFGLPAEQYAMKTGTHPRRKTAENIATFKRQLKSLGFSYDWSREVATTDPGYYRWTQWIFLQLFDTWYDPDCVWTGPDGVERTGRGRPISELPIPEGVKGEEPVRRYRDSRRLAYQQSAPVNWCPALGTVLANEEVTAEGLSERGGHPVERVPLRQWMLRITAYSQRLLEGLDGLDWPDSVKSLQRNWIGRSVGAELDFFVGDAREEAVQISEFNHWEKSRASTGFPDEPGDFVIRVYTTRPDTLYGATYMVLAPEHPLVSRITTPEQREAVEAYQADAARKSDLDRTDLAKAKTGVSTGGYAVNPVNGLRVPIWIADYVLSGYGTGAIMAVPGHDVRDFEFALAMDLPIKQVVRPPADYSPTKEEAAARRLGEASSRDVPSALPFCGKGTATHSSDYDGYESDTAKEKIVECLTSKGMAKAAANTRLRDWLFSRQHVWGEPFPIWHELDADGNETGLLRTDPEDALPVRIPDDYDFKALMRRKADGDVGTDPPLAAAPKDWLFTTASDGTRLKRETNSMPQWAGSCWYYLRYCDPGNERAFVDPLLEKYWLPVDLYIGGAEHAVLHLLYSRFWHMVLFDREHVTTPEPYRKLVNQGMILGEPELHGYRRPIQKGPDVADPHTLQPILRARGHIQGIGALSAQKLGESPGERAAAAVKLEDAGRTSLYSALRREVLKLDEVGVGAEEIERASPFEVVRGQIAQDVEGSPWADRDPIEWWNNERGVDATMRLLSQAAESLTADRPARWVGAQYVDDSGEEPVATFEGETFPVARVSLGESEVTKTKGRLVLVEDEDAEVISKSEKMSKSRGNVINPDDVVTEYGADALRLYEMFMGPLEQTKPWSMSGVEGVSRFLGRAWRLIVDDRAEVTQLVAQFSDAPPTAEQDRAVHQTIRGVSEDLDKLQFNTAISKLMEFVNAASSWDVRPREAMETFVLLLSPFAPHLGEELWQALGHEGTLAYERWPTFDASKVVESEVEIPVQINGKVRARITVPADADTAALQAAAEADDSVRQHLDGKTVRKAVVIPGRMVNFVVG